jgi:hypothetical protein
MDISPLSTDAIKLGGDVYEIVLNHIRLTESRHFIQIFSDGSKSISLNLDFQMRTNRTDQFEMRYVYGDSSRLATGEFRISNGPFHKFGLQSDGRSSISEIVLRNYEEFISHVDEWKKK